MLSLAVFLSAFLPLPHAHALVSNPSYKAAEEMGYEVAGDLEFRRGSTRISDTQMRANIREINQICPFHFEHESHFIVLAWSDREYPGHGENQSAGEIPTSSLEQSRLADERARAVESSLRTHFKGAPISFERVNMATRVPQTVRPGSKARSTSEDVKQVLKLAGAAPTGQLELGLFGEFGQRSKALIWVDCGSGQPGPQKISKGETYQLATTGAN